MKYLSNISLGLVVIAIVWLPRYCLAAFPTVCTQENVDACLVHMKQFELSEYDAIVPTFNESQLTFMCNEYIKTDECLDALIPDCPPYTQFRYRSIEESWNYLCKYKKQEYLDIQECLTKEKLHEAGGLCSATWEHRVKELTNDKFREDDTLNTDGWSALCDFANDYLGCIYKAVDLHCSAAAAEWQEGFDDILIQPLLKLVGCKKDGAVYKYVIDDDGGLSRNMIIIVAVSISIGVIVMVMIAILLLRQKKDRRQRDHGAPNNMNNMGGAYDNVVYTPDGGAIAIAPMPPPYKEKDSLGPEFGTPMGYPAPSMGPPSTAPPSYRPAQSVMGESVASGHTSRSHHSNHSTRKY